MAEVNDNELAELLAAGVKLLDMVGGLILLLRVALAETAKGGDGS